MTMDGAPNSSAFADRIRKWANTDFPGFRKAAEEVAALTESPGWETVEKLVNERAALLFNASVAARTRDQAEYVADAGEIRGLKQAIDAPAVLLAVYRSILDEREDSVGE